MPKNQKILIVEKVEQLVEKPESLKNNIKILKGEPYYRLRVGNWRIKFDDDGVIIDIIEIFPRGSNYKK